MSAAPVTILMVDDDAADIDLTREGLRDSKLLNDFHAVHDGVECLHFLRRDPPYEDAPRPDVILLDLNMPRQGGLETLAAIREDPDLTKIPVVILTTSDADKDVARAYELHANCYVCKPVDLDQFIDVVQQIEDFWFQVVRLPSRHA